MKVYSVISNERIAVITENYEKAKDINNLIGGFIQEVEMNKWYDTSLIKKKYSKFVWAVKKGEENKNIDNYQHYKSGIGTDVINEKIRSSKHKSIFNGEDIYSFCIYSNREDFESLEDEYVWARNVFKSINEKCIKDGVEKAYELYVDKR